MRRKIPAQVKEFFAYLWIVRGLKIETAAGYARSLAGNGNGKNARTARRHYADFQTHWWEVPE